MPERLVAPWTPEQVDALNEYQTDAPMHPFTCPHRDLPAHKYHEDRERGLLEATPEGWRCKKCAYTQEWAYPWMADLSWWQ